MGLEDLIKTLKANEQKQIDTLWAEARAEADTIHGHVAEEIARISKEHEEQLASACQRSARSISSDAEIKAREKRLHAYRELEKVLYESAGRLLARLRSNDYEAVFGALVNELPGRQWERIMVNTEDAELAARFFTPDIIEPAPDIIGGIRVSASQGKIVIDNTLEKRLERLWPFILPDIIKKIEEKYEETVTSQNN